MLTDNWNYVFNVLLQCYMSIIGHDCIWVQGKKKLKFNNTITTSQVLNFSWLNFISIIKVLDCAKFIRYNFKKRKYNNKQVSQNNKYLKVSNNAKLRDHMCNLRFLHVY